MKALEILQEELEELRSRGQQYSYIREKKKKLNEAIKELEELQNRILELEVIETDLIMKELNNRSCSNCKHDYVDIDDNCQRCNRYYEDKFEQKDN